MYTENDIYTCNQCGQDHYWNDDTCTLRCGGKIVQEVQDVTLPATDTLPELDLEVHHCVNCARPVAICVSGMHGTYNMMPDNRDI